MKFEARSSKHPNRRKLVKLDAYGNPTDAPIIVDIIRDDVVEGNEVPGTPITADRLNEGNWRGDQTISWTKLGTGDPDPTSVIDRAQMFTRADGRTWILAPGHLSTPIEVGIITSTRVFVDGEVKAEVKFTTDPQEQIDQLRFDLKDVQIGSGGNGAGMITNTALNWQEINPVLPTGMFGLETTRHKLKLGDGERTWNELPFFVTAPHTYYVPIPPSKGLEHDSWEFISNIANRISNGTINPNDPSQNPYSIGDQKTICIGTEEIVVQILGFNHDEKTSGGKAGITFGMRDLLVNRQRMHPTDTTAGGWNGSEMRNTFLPSVFNQMPYDLRERIVEVKKYSASHHGGAAITTNDRLFLFSKIEVANTPFDVAANLDTQYEFWRSFRPASVDGNLFKRLGGAGINVPWWLRTISSETMYRMTRHQIGQAGDRLFAGDLASRLNNGVCFGFCV